jgi:hypothetical protein
MKMASTETTMVRKLIADALEERPAVELLGLELRDPLYIAGGGSGGRWGRWLEPRPRYASAVTVTG